MSTTPPGWHTDPTGRHQLRYWDGAAWTEHVSSGGQQGSDLIPTPGQVSRTEQPDYVPVAGTEAERIQRQVQDQAHIAQPSQVANASQGAGGGTVFTEPILVVNQKAKLLEVNNEYFVFDQHGRQIGAVRQVGQSGVKKAMRVLTSMDQYMTHKLELTDMTGQVQLRMTRPAKLMKSTVIVERPDGTEVGRLVQENMIGKIRFGLQAGGTAYGSLNAENWRAWNFSIQDHTGTEVARITKTWEGLAKTMFTTADNYVVQIHRQLEDPLRSLVVASALTVDTALKQDARGFG